MAGGLIRDYRFTAWDLVILTIKKLCTEASRREILINGFRKQVKIRQTSEKNAFGFSDGMCSLR